VPSENRGDLIPLTAIMSLVYPRNQQVNAFQVLFAVFYSSHGLQKRAREIFMKQGLMVSPSTNEGVMKEMAIAVRERLERRVRTVPQMILIDNVNQKVPPPSSSRWIPLFTVWYQIGVRRANLQAKSHIDNSTAGFAADLLGAQTLLPEGSIGIQVDWRGGTV
jgi:hypothetical protein